MATMEKQTDMLPNFHKTPHFPIPQTSPYPTPQHTTPQPLHPSQTQNLCDEQHPHRKPKQLRRIRQAGGALHTSADASIAHPVPTQTMRKALTFGVFVEELAPIDAAVGDADIVRCPACRHCIARLVVGGRDVDDVDVAREPVNVAGGESALAGTARVGGHVDWLPRFSDAARGATRSKESRTRFVMVGKVVRG